MAAGMVRKHGGGVVVQVIVLNGGSSSGKSSIARCLQGMLGAPWLAMGMDTLIEVMPARLWGAAEGILVGADGSISVGAVFRELEEAWMTGVVAMARAGARIIHEEVFLEGAAGQARLRARLIGLEVLWVGVRCDAAVAAAREAARGDRVVGMAALQAEAAHRGVVYDLEVDTAWLSAEGCAEMIAGRVL